MKKTIGFILTALCVGSGSLHAEDKRIPAQFIFVQETSVDTAFRSQMGIGLLDKRFNGSRGVAITNYFGLDFAVTPDFGMNVGLPLAGTISGGPDNYGIGNIQLGAKAVIPRDRISIAVGADLSLPTAQSKAGVGVFTRKFTQYVKDQFAVSPYVAISYANDRLSLHMDFGTDLQIFTKSAAGRDRVEDTLFYDAGAGMNVFEEIWATIEMGGYSTLTYSGNNQTSLFAGPGIRYQDHEVSLGAHLVAPFRKPDRDVTDFMMMFDFRWLF